MSAAASVSDPMSNVTVVAQVDSMNLAERKILLSIEILWTPHIQQGCLDVFQRTTFILPCQLPETEFGDLPSAERIADFARDRFKAYLAPLKDKVLPNMMELSGKKALGEWYDFTRDKLFFVGITA